MSPKGRPRERSLFGQWIDLLCALFQLDQKEWAGLAGIDSSTISHATSGRTMISEDTAHKLWTAIVLVAQKQQLILPPLLEEGFLNSAGHVSHTQRELSEQRLQVLQNMLMYSEQIRRKDEEIARLQDVQKRLLEQLSQLNRAAFGQRKP